MRTHLFSLAVGLTLLISHGSYAQGSERPLSPLERAGKHVFDKQTFGGNGSVCSTCHIGKAGTFNPEQAQALFKSDPDNPLFRAIDSDDGAGASLVVNSNFHLIPGGDATFTNGSRSVNNNCTNGPC